MFGGRAHVLEAAPPQISRFLGLPPFTVFQDISLICICLLNYRTTTAPLIFRKNSEISGSVVVRFRTGDAFNFASLRRPLRTGEALRWPLIFRIAEAPHFASAGRMVEAWSVRRSKVKSS